MQAEVDMSGRVEETTRPTVLALSDGLTFSIRIAAGQKRILLHELRGHKPHWGETQVNVSIFSVLLYLLLKDNIEQLNLVMVDPEYPGHEPDIKDRVMTLCRRQGIVVYKDQIAFGSVRKRSPAHKLALRVYQGYMPPDRIITAEDVLRELGK